jgi:N-methylhydantoinase A
MHYKLGVDVGGTFTDVFMMSEDTGLLAVYKTASTPDDPSKAILAGIEEILAAQSLRAEAVSYLAHGTTVATNAIIEQRGGKVGLLTTKGFRDLLEIGRQTRPKLYDLQKDYPPPLVPRDLRLEIAERILHTGEVFLPLNEDQARGQIENLKQEKIESVVVCLLYAYLNPKHEIRIREMIEEQIPGCHISVSHQILPEFREYERLSTTTINAFLMPTMGTYLRNFDAKARKLGLGVAPLVNQCNGGVMSVEAARRLPVRTVLSGPAAGVVGALFIAESAGFPNLITFDMGGTSTDVSLSKEGITTISNDRWVGGYPVKIPSVDVKAVGAGGGSIAWLDLDGLMKVGPQSAGAVPGPVCYGLGGSEPTVTDANMVLGRLNQKSLLGGRMKINADASKEAIGQLSDSLKLGIIETAQGVIRIVTANMVKAIRAVSIERGHDPKEFILTAFGGAGPLHACGVARELEIRKVIIPPNPGILCAMGLLVADVRNDYVKTQLIPYNQASPEDIEQNFLELENAGRQWLTNEGFEPEVQRLVRSLDMRYMGQNFELTVEAPPRKIDKQVFKALQEGFHEEHARYYGHCSPQELIQIVNFRVTAFGMTPKLSLKKMPNQSIRQQNALLGHRNVWFDKSTPLSTKIFDRSCLVPGDEIIGPAIIEQMDSTTMIPPSERCVVDQLGNLIIHLGGKK